ncbi:MAG: OmpA family protein [Neisseriaceae bacterium]|nr:OmpA family protein [Neisseriaceae bacterium]
MLRCKSKIFLSLITVAILSACAGSGTVVKSDGTTDEPRWHKWDKTWFNKSKGTFPDLSSLREVRSGLTKDQLYYLIGRPQYSEAWRSHDWNYLFHFHTPGRGTNDVTTCQFKVLFDKDMFARSFYWKAVDPVDATCPPDSGKQVLHHTLQTDVLFSFDKYGKMDIQGQGKLELQEFANKVRQIDKITAIYVTGHTDYLGDDAYNERLALQRAETVRQYLTDLGLPAALILADGRGEREPVVQCYANVPNLKQCLQPNRRVEIRVNSESMVNKM